MAFESKNFQQLTGRLSEDRVIRCTYRTTDSVATVNTVGYFNEIADSLKVGDIIDVVVVSAAGALTGKSEVIVASNAAGVVDVTDGVAATITDTD